jgi:hypothetical protein
MGSAVVLSTAPAGAQSVAFRIVALTGTDGPYGPGLGPGVVYSTLSGVGPIDDAGRVSFGATMPGVSGSIWTERSTTKVALAKTGEQAAGLPAGVLYSGNLWYQTNHHGVHAWRASIAGPGVTSSTNQGLWSEASGAPVLILRKGEVAPGTPEGSTFSGMTPWGLNNAGRIVFVGGIEGPLVGVSTNGIWTISGPGTAELVVLRNDPVPGDPGFVFDNLGVPAIDGEGFVTVWAAAVSTTTNKYIGLWTNRSGSMAAIARTGQQAPGTPQGCVFSSLDNPYVDSQGRTAFFAAVSGPGVSGVNEAGVWAETGTPTNLILLARAGEPAPGTAQGVNFARFFPPLLMGNGTFVLPALVAGPGVTSSSERGLWIHEDGALRLLVMAGQGAPGTGPGVTFSTVAGPTCNERGQVAFSGFLTGPGVTSQNDFGGWVYSPGRGFAKLFREQDLFEITPGDERPIGQAGYWSYGTGRDGGMTGLSPDGELTLHFPFPGSSVLVAATLPSPCTANCDESTSAPLLTANDFQCFINRFAEGLPYANCDGSTQTPTLTANDFMCFLSSFAAGCS